jgi:uncharacterized protein YndB with AHSA1/START domain
MASAPVYVCPADVVAAPIERVWAILLDSSRYGEWTDAHPTRIEPPGPAAPGQVMESDTRGFGLNLRIRISVREVDSEHHRVGFDVDLPFGIHNAAAISCAALDGSRTRVQYG